MKDRNNVLILILAILYTVGVLGLLNSSTRPYFIMLTPYNLLITMIFYVWANRDFRFHFFLLSFIVMVCGWTIEWAGVHTGVLFGKYEYGHTLGYKIQRIPLIIGVNWFLLCFSSRAIFKKVFKNVWLVTVSSSLLMCGLDFLIEPIAVKFDFWNWDKNIIPVQNYFMWFISSFMLNMIIQKSDLKLNFKSGIIIFSTQTMFFGVLNYFLK
ncbi:MAG: carotenoid biosynthesis protein [Bacteroidota bacterium]